MAAYLNYRRQLMAGTKTAAVDRQMAEAKAAEARHQAGEAKAWECRRRREVAPAT